MGMSANSHKLITENYDWAKGLAVNIGRRVGRRIPNEDLASEGTVALCEAASRYDDQEGAAQFRTFAFNHIKGRVLRFAGKWEEPRAYNDQWLQHTDAAADRHGARQANGPRLSDEWIKPDGS